MSFKASFRQSASIRLQCCVHYLKLLYYGLLYVILVLSAIALLVYVYSTGRGYHVGGITTFCLLIVGFVVLLVLLAMFVEECCSLSMPSLAKYEASLSYRKLEEEKGKEKEKVYFLV